MYMQFSMSRPLLLFLLLSSLVSATVLVRGEGISGGSDGGNGRKLAGGSPLTAKASFIRHWEKQVSGDIPKPWLLRMTSPLDAIQLATFSKLADQNLLPTKLDAFCAEAHLLCYYPEATTSPSPVPFYHYISSNPNFTTSTPKPAIKNNSANKVKRWIEPGRFFREKMLKVGTVMTMSDVHEKMPKKAFLPKQIVAKIPSSSGNVQEMKRFFRVKDNSTMSGFIKKAIHECRRAPSPGESKLCVGSAEDMVDFVTSILGKNVVLRTTKNSRGSSGDIMIGSVKGINGGRVTKSVSCHQSLFPYLLYFCHYVPKVRVYQADILDPKSKEIINQAMAVCHVETTFWNPKHGAFVALGSGPGKIEVCHWMSENDMSWTIAD